MWSLPALEELDVSGNKLDPLPDGMSLLKSLKKLHLMHCDLLALPEKCVFYPFLCHDDCSQSDERKLEGKP